MKNKKQPLAKIEDLVAMVTLPLVAAVLAWVFNLNFLVSTLLFFGVPSVYLACRKPSSIKRCLLFSSTFTLIGFLGDFYAIKDGSWHTPTMFGFKLLNVIPLEDLIWFFLGCYLILSFYELFFDHVTHKALGRRMHQLFALITAAALLMTALLVFHGTIASISYFYLKSCIILAIIPLVTFLIEFPRFVGVFLKMTAYFSALFLVTEIVGQHNGHWSFPGTHFIARVPLGPYHIPLEELLFYIVMFASVTVAYFELFDDNRLKFRWSRS